MPLRDGFFSTATQTSCCNRIQRSNRVRLLVVSTHDFPDNQNWLERNFSGFLLRTLVVGRRQHSESIEVALEWSKEV